MFLYSLHRHVCLSYDTGALTCDTPGDWKTMTDVEFWIECLSGSLLLVPSLMVGYFDDWSVIAQSDLTSAFTCMEHNFVISVNHTNQSVHILGHTVFKN